MTLQIPMSSPDLQEAEIAAVERVLRSARLSLGPYVIKFEQQVAAYIGVPHGIGVSSGTAGLHLCVIAAGVGMGDIVITTPFSFIASANCILYERGIPVFVDVDPLTGNIDPQRVAEALDDLTKGGAPARRWLPPALRETTYCVERAQLKAILPVHIFGQPADMDPILSVAQRHNVAVIEDACEALGAEYKGRKTGALGDAAVFAFYPNKQITTGEGGMIVTARDDWEPLFRSLRNQGRDVFDAWLNHSRLGYNYRLDEMSAALGCVQMERLDELLTKRQRVAEWYHRRLAPLDWLTLPSIAPTTTRMSWFVYAIRLDSRIDRDRLLRTLEAAGIPTRPYFTPIHWQPFYMERFGYRRGDFPVADDLGRRSLALPFSGVMTEEQVDMVCQHLTEAVRALA